MAEDVTQLLVALSSGHKSAADRLVPLVYDELRRVADELLRGERPNHTLQATALVHEAYLKLADQRATKWEDRAHFFAIAARAMRQILVDHARTRNREKRGGERYGMSLDAATGFAVAPGSTGIDLIALDDALIELSRIHPQAGQVVEMRFFGGLSLDETAIVLGVSSRTVEREWRYARAWLFQQLGGHGSFTGKGDVSEH